MGCTQSKIDNEEAVTRCKERKQHMKAAVATRNAFAAAHSGYQVSLKNTGAALSDYAHGEVQDPQFSSAKPDHTAAAAASYDAPPPPPPPPIPDVLPAPVQRATSMPEIKLKKPETKPAGTTIEEEDDMEAETEGALRRRRNRIERGVVAKDERDPSPQVKETEVQIPAQPGHHTTWDYFFPSVENASGPTSGGVDPLDVKMDPEESQRAKREKEESVVEEREIAEKHDTTVPEVPIDKAVEPPPSPASLYPEETVTGAKKAREGASSGPLVEARKVPKTNVNLLQILIQLDDHFLQASESAREVSKMLEGTRLHYHSNFADNRGHIDHSARVMRVITWNRSFRGLPNVDYGQDDFDAEEQETHATVLDKILAWEKKLYNEVKAGELMKIEYQKKIALLNKQKKRGADSEALEKAKAAVSHLHTRYIVDMQSLDSTVAEINRLRDLKLYPKLVQLVDGMATMWETMRFHHEQQSKIAMALKSLDISQAPKETTEHHHERTRQLWAVIREWHSQFANFVKYQKEYIKELKNWLKLNLIPIESSVKERVSSPPRIQSPPIQHLLYAWHDYLEKVPDELLRTAINNFAALIETIKHHQEDEMKLKLKCAETWKELERKTRYFEDWYKKHAHRRASDEVEVGREDSNQRQIVAEKHFMVDLLEKRWKEEKEAYDRQCLQVREKSLATLKTRLPELFRALLDFAASCSEMYMELKSISQSHR